MKVEVAVLGFPSESNIEPYFGSGHNLSLICQPTSEDMKLYFIIRSVPSFLPSCVHAMAVSAAA